MCLKYQLEACIIQGGQRSRYASQLNEGDFKTKLQSYVVEWAANLADLGPEGLVIAPSPTGDAVDLASLNMCLLFVPRSNDCDLCRPHEYDSFVDSRAVRLVHT
jgi:hypothetical protein